MKYILAVLLVLSIAVYMLAGYSPTVQVQAPEPTVKLTVAEDLYIRSRTITIGIETDYPPVIFKDNSGLIRGLSKEYLNLISQKTGLRFRYAPIGGLDQVLEELKNGKVDLVTSLKKTEERQKYMAFTRPYITIGTVMLFTAPIKSYPIVVGYSGSYAIKDLVFQQNDNFKSVPFKNDEDVFQNLVIKKIDGAIMDEASARYLEIKSGRKFSRAPVYFKYNLSLAYDLKNDLLGSILDKGIEAITEAEHQEIARQYLGGDHR